MNPRRDNLIGQIEANARRNADTRTIHAIEELKALLALEDAPYQRAARALTDLDLLGITISDYKSAAGYHIGEALIEVHGIPASACEECGAIIAPKIGVTQGHSATCMYAGEPADWQ